MKKLQIIASILVSASISAQTSGINVNNMDKSADPRNDFYTFANGNWQKTFKMSETDSRYGSFNEIYNNNLKNLKAILETAGRNKAAAPNTDAQRLRDFYNTAMDSAKADKLGYSPIEGILKQIESVKNVGEILALKSDFDMKGINLFFAGGVGTDMKNSKRYIFGFSQAGFGLGNRDFYYQEQFSSIQTEYKNYLAALFELTGVSKDISEKNATIVFEFEKKLADKAFTSSQMRDIEKMYNLYTASDLNKLTPVISWNAYFKVRNTTVPDTMLVAMVDFMKEMNNLLEKTPVEDLKVYSKAHLLMASAPYLSSKFEEVHFNFHGRVLSGAKQMKARYQRVLNATDRSIGHILSREFVKKHFPPEAKVKLNKMIDNLVLAYRDRINSRDWMSTETKKQAQRKLDLLIRKIGYPEKWDDYSRLTITTNSYWENVIAAAKLDVIENMEDLKKPVDRTRWQMTPITVNAYYDPSSNEIAFPAAILQPPFFDPKADDAANYGTMGSIIGHELTHGFDDQGSQFDADGNMKMWWTEADFKNFKDKTELIIKQFDGYVAIDTLHVKGEMTQGENIADLGGLTMSYNAYKKSLAGKPSKVMDGFTGEQRFFIAWAQGWKTITRDAEMKRLLTVDYHSPGYFRAFAPLSNMPEFYQAFNVKEGDKMYTPANKRVEIW